MPAGTGRSLRAGALRERIQFLSFSRTTDHGFATESWSDAFSVWAGFSLGAGIYEQTQDRGAWKTEVDFDVRYRTDITPDMRVLWRGKTFEIASIQSERVLGRVTVRCIEESAP